MFKSGPESLFSADSDAELSATSLARLPLCHMLPTTTIMYKFFELVSQCQLKHSHLHDACLPARERSLQKDGSGKSCHRPIFIDIHP